MRVCDAAGSIVQDKNIGLKIKQEWRKTPSGETVVTVVGGEASRVLHYLGSPGEKKLFRHHLALLQNPLLPLCSLLLSPWSSWVSAGT